MKKIGIVIVNWNSLKYTNSFISDFKSISPTDSTLVVVNNSKEDNTQLLKKQSKNIKIINTNSNLGYAGGLNKGIEYLKKKTECDWFLLINNDVKLTRELFSDLLNVEDTNTIYSPVILNINNDIVQNTGGRINIWVGGAINLNKEKLYKDIKKVNPDFVSGCCMFVSKDVIIKVGDFEESYGSYCEDVDFCVRAVKGGVRLEILWDTVLRHYHSMSTKNISGYKDYLITRNVLWFARRNIIGLKKYLFILNSIVVNFFTILTRYRNLKHYFTGVRDGLK